MEMPKSYFIKARFLSRWASKRKCHPCLRNVTYFKMKVANLLANLIAYFNLLCNSFNVHKVTHIVNIPNATLNGTLSDPCTKI